MFQRTSSPRKPARSSRRFFLEELENRLVPSAVSWTGTAGDLSWNDSGNWNTNKVPTSADDVTINISVPGTISITGASFARSINDSTAALSIASGGSLTLTAVPAATTFGDGLTVASGGTLAVGAGATVNIGGGQTLTDNGTVTFASGDALAFDYAYNVAEQLTVGSGGLLTATGTSFYAASFANGNTSNITVAFGGHLQANTCTFGVSQLTFQNGSTLNAGDLVADAFNLPLFLPAGDVQYLSAPGNPNTNQSFQAINILPGSLASGQTLALNAIGSAGAANLSYVFPGGFTVASGASVTVGPNVPVHIGGGQTLTDNGTITFNSGDAVVFDYAYNVAEQLTVASGGLLTATGTNFYAASFGNGNTSNITVAFGGHLQANTCTFGVSQLTFQNGSTLNAGDLVADAFNLPLFLPAGDVQYLSAPGNPNTNQSFQAINILPGSLASGQTLALNAIGSAGAANLSYVFPGGFTVASGASVTVGPNVPVHIGGGQTLTDSGTVSFSSGDAVVFDYAYNVAEQLTVASGGRSE